MSNLFEISKINSYPQNDSSIVIKFYYHKYLNLIDSLIKNDYLNESYFEHISIDYNNLLSTADKKFIKMLYNENQYQFNAKIDNIENVIEELIKTEFVYSKYALNTSLLENYLKNKDSVKLEGVITLFNSDFHTLEFFITYLKSFDIQRLLNSNDDIKLLNVDSVNKLDYSGIIIKLKFSEKYIDDEFTDINKLCDFLFRKRYLDFLLTELTVNWVNFFEIIFDNFCYDEILFNEFEIFNFVQYCLTIFDNDALLEMPDEFSIYLEQNINLFNNSFYLSNERKIEIINELKLKFSDLKTISNFNEQLILSIKVNNNYVPSIQNFKFLSQHFNICSDENLINFENKALTIINRANNKSLSVYLNSNISLFAEEYVAQNISLTDSKPIAISFINNDSIDISIRKKYIDNFAKNFNYLDQILNIELCIHLLKHKKIVGTINNLRKAFIISQDFEDLEKSSELFDDIINWVNEKNIYKVNTQLYIDTDEKLFIKVTNCNKINDIVYKNILSLIDYTYENPFKLDIDKNKLKFLINTKKMKISTATGISSAREMYPSYIYDFILNNIENYLDFLEEDNTLIKLTEIKYILENYKFTENIFIRILKLSDNDIDLKNLYPNISNFSVETKIIALEKFAIDKEYNNIQYLESLYIPNSDERKQTDFILSIFEKNLSDILINIKLTNHFLVYDLINSGSDFNEHYKIYINYRKTNKDSKQEIFLLILSKIFILSANSYKESIKELMELNNYEQAFFDIFINKNPKVENTAKNKKLINALKELQLIGKTSDEKDGKILINSLQLN